MAGEEGKVVSGGSRLIHAAVPSPLSRGLEGCPCREIFSTSATLNLKDLPNRTGRISPRATFAYTDLRLTFKRFATSSIVRRGFTLSPPSHLFFPRSPVSYCSRKQQHFKGVSCVTGHQTTRPRSRYATSGPIVTLSECIC